MATAPVTIALDRCPTCHGPDAEDFTFGAAALRRCSVCATVYSQRYADPEAVYVDGYYTGATDFGLDIRHPRFQAFLAELNAGRAGRLVERLGPGGAVLDVGCGTGEFLTAMRDGGWRAAGVDPIAESAAMARERGHDVVTAMLEDSGVPQGEWDLVSAFHVIEHVPDGPAFLALLARWARPGGHVVVETPNWDSRLRRASAERWIHLRPLEHLVHHTPATMARAMREAGLEPVAVQAPTWPSSLQTPAEALADLGRFAWTRLPAPAARLLDRPARAWDERRGHGMVLFALGRVPG